MLWKLGLRRDSCLVTRVLSQRVQEVARKSVDRGDSSSSSLESLLGIKVKKRMGNE